MTYYFNNEIACKIISNKMGWITAETESGKIIKGWAGQFNLRLTK